MNKAALYCQSNQFQKRDAHEALQEFIDTIKWRPDECDSVLDAGCGAADVTVDVLMPILPLTFRRLIGVDISTEVLDYARNTQIHPRLSFEQFDLCTDLEQQSLSTVEPFDHIFSFHTFHTIPNREKCLKNFRQLLSASGDMLLAFVANHPIYDVYKEQSLDNKWAEYMFDIDEMMPPYQYSDDPAEEFRGMLRDAGFTHYDVWLRDKSFKFEDVETMRGTARESITFSLGFYNFNSALFNLQI